jgi:hypothetical protein
MTMWTAEFYEDARGKRPVEIWFDSLSDVEFAAMDAAITHVLERQGLALASTSWLTALGQGLYEFRVRHDAATIESMYGAAGASTSRAPGKILLRLFVHFHGDRTVLLLHGYNKGKDNSSTRQNKEIQRAHKMLRAWRADQSRNTKRNC